MKKIHQYSLGLALVLSLYGCGTVPITGRRSLNLVSDEAVLSASRDQYNSFVASSRSKGAVVQDTRIQGIAQKLIKATYSYLTQHNYEELWNQMQWEVNVVRDNQVNAFCMPGGKIVVYTGLSSLVGAGKGSDDELAAVIGHEIGHAIARHANERMSRAQMTNLGGQILSGVLGNASTSTQAIVGTLYGLGTNVGVTLPFNRKQELEADKIGLVLMAIAGYNPEYAVSLWQKMASVSSGDNSNSFTSTHPSEEKRIAEIQAYMATAKQYYKPVVQSTNTSKTTSTTNTTRRASKKK